MHSRGKKLAFVAALFAAVFLLSPTPTQAAFNWGGFWGGVVNLFSGNVGPATVKVALKYSDGSAVSGQQQLIASAGNIMDDGGGNYRVAGIPTGTISTTTINITYRCNNPTQTQTVSNLRSGEIRDIGTHSCGTKPGTGGVGNITGKLTYSDGTVLANRTVSVAITFESATTGIDGSYTIRNIAAAPAPGKTITVRFSCPSSITQTDGKVISGQTTTVNGDCGTNSSGGGGVPPPTTQAGSVTGTVQYYASASSISLAVGASVSIIGTGLSVAPVTTGADGVYVTGTLNLPSSIGVTCTYQGKSGSTTAATHSDVNVVNCTIPYSSSGGGGGGAPPPTPAPTEGMFSGCVTVGGVSASGLTVTLSGGPLTGNKTYNVGADPNSSCPAGSYWHTEKFQFPINKNFTITFNPPPGGIAKVQSDVPLTVADKKMNWNFVSDVAKLHIKLLIKGTTIPVPGYSIKISNETKKTPDIYVSVDGKGEYLYEQGSRGDTVYITDGNNTDSLYSLNTTAVIQGLPADSTLKVDLVPRGYCLIIGTVHYLGSVSQPPLSMEVRQNSDVIAYAKPYRSSAISGGRNYDFILKGAQIVVGKSYTVAVKWGATDPGQQIEAKTIALSSSCSESAPATVDFTTYGQGGMPDPVVSVQTIKKYYLDEPTGVMADTPLEIYEGSGNYSKPPILTRNTDSNGLLVISKGQLSDGTYSVHLKDRKNYTSNDVTILIDGFSHSYLMIMTPADGDNCEDHPTGVIEHLIFCGSARDIYLRYPQLWQAWSDKLRWMRQKYPQLASIPEKIEIVNVKTLVYTNTNDPQHVVIYFSPAHIQDVLANRSDGLEVLVSSLKHEVGHNLDRVRRSPATGFSSDQAPFIDYFNTAKSWVNQEKAKDITAFWRRYPILTRRFFSDSPRETYADFFREGLDDKANLDREIDTIPDEQARAAFHKLVDLVITP